MPHALLLCALIFFVNPFEAVLVSCYRKCLRIAFGASLSELEILLACVDGLVPFAPYFSICIVRGARVAVCPRTRAELHCLSLLPVSPVLLASALPGIPLFCFGCLCLQSLLAMTLLSLLSQLPAFEPLLFYLHLDCISFCPLFGVNGF